jgi:cyanate lyase
MHPAHIPAKVAFVDKLLTAKAASGKSFDEIAEALGVTNAYAAQLFFNQAMLKPETAAKLKKAVPQLR